MRKKINIAIAAVLLAAFAGLFLWLRHPAPQAVLRRAQGLLASEKTMHVEAIGSLLGASAAAGPLASDATGVDMTVHADLDRTDPLKPASALTFEFRQQADGRLSKLSGETRRKDGAHYLRLDAADNLDSPDVRKLIGLWVRHDRPFSEFLVPPGEAALSARPLDTAGLEALRKAVATLDLFKVRKTLPAETIGGQEADHFVVEADMQALSALLMKYRQLRSSAELAPADVLAVTDQIIRWGQPYGEVWIGRRDGRFLRLQLQTQLSAADGSTAGGAILRLDFSNYGLPVAVQAPDARDVQDVLGPSFLKRLNLAGDRAVSAAVGSGTGTLGLPNGQSFAVAATDSDRDGLSDSQEAFYGSDPWNPDTDGDGWTDGLEVEKGMNPNGPGTLFGFGL